MKHLKKLFSAPVFADEAKTQQAYLLNIIVWALICVPVPFVVYSIFFTPEIINRVILQTVFGESVNILLLIMLHRGAVKAASVLQVVAFWFFFTATAITGTGVQSEAYLLGYGLVIAIAGSLLGGSGALAMTILSLVSGIGMVYASGQGLLPTGYSSSPLSTWIVSFVLFPVGAVLQYLGADLTRQALARARNSEERYRLISEASSDYTFSTHLDRQGEMYLHWVDGAFERMTGYTYEEYVAAGGWRSHLYSEDVEEDNQAMAKLMNNQPAVSQVRTFKKNREIVWVRVYANPVWDEKHHRLAGIVGAVQDINEQKQAEEALRRSESIYRRAIEVAGAVPYHQTFDKDGNIYYDFMGEGIRGLTGYGPDEFTDDLWGTLVMERHLLSELEPYSLEEAIQQVRTGNIPMWKCEHRIRARDGKIRWVFEAAVDLRDDDNTAYGSVGLYQDITERKKSEDLLKYERDLLQIFLDNIPDTVYFKDADSRFVRINAAQARMLGVASPQDAIGKTDQDYFPPTVLLETFVQEERKIVETGESVVNRIEFNPTPDGQLRWLSATKVPVKDASGQVVGIIGISRDVTEQKLAQEYEQNRRAILEKVLRLGQEVTEGLDFVATLKKIWHGARSELNFDRLGIYIYEPETNTMDGSFGTNNQGEMIEEWNTHICLDEKSTEAEAFIGVLKETDGLYFTPNYEADHDVQNVPIMQGVKDFVAVAARVGDKPVAVICADQAISKRPITSEQLEALRLFAGYAGLAIENSRLNEVLQSELQQQRYAEEQEARRRSMLEKVLELGKRVTETNDIQTTLERIWHGVHDDLGFDRLGVFLYNESRNSMDSMIGTDIHGNMENTTGHWFPISEWSNFKAVLEKPDGFFFTHNYDKENNIPEGHEMYGVKDYAAVAAWAGNKPVAVISVDQVVSKRPIASEQLEALRLFAGYAALALENARLYAALQEELIQQKQAEEREVRRRFMLEKVVELGKQVTETTDFVTTLQRIWHGIHDNLNFDRIGIFLYNPELNSVMGTYGTGRQGEMEEEWDLHISLDGETRETLSFLNVIREENGMYTTHDYAGERDIPKGDVMEGVRDYAAIAAWAGDKPVGVICVDNLISGNIITEEQLEALRLFAGYAGLAIQNARLNATLEEDLTHRQTLIEELEAKNAELERFTYTVSHDLKSPLVTITGFLGYVEKDAMAGDTARVKSGIERIYKAAQKMQNLLNDLLELSRIGRLMNEPENIPFNDIVREAVDHVRGRLEANKVQVEVQEALPVVRVDKIRLIEVVQNLLDNAAKFTASSPEPRIKIGSNGFNEKGLPILYVSDNGIGIAPKYHEKIFGLFDKLDPNVEGTGVGLTLVKRIIEVHGGKIWLESQPGMGTTFYFTLPGIPDEEK